MWQNIVLGVFVSSLLKLLFVSLAKCQTGFLKQVLFTERLLYLHEFATISLQLIEVLANLVMALSSNLVFCQHGFTSISLLTLQRPE